MCSRSSRLALERLDDRNAPSSIPGNDIATTDWMPDPTTPPCWGILVDDGNSVSQNNLLGNQKPVIVNFRVVVGTGWIATYSGTVLDENPAGLTVMLTGDQSCLGDGKPVTTDENGNFTFTGSVHEMVDSGWAYADVSDDKGLRADQKDFYVDVR